MSLELWSTIGTFGTFVVVAATAVAALVQLRHMRGSNQIVALTECRETLESEEFQDAEHFVRYVLPRRLLDTNEALRIVAGEAQFEGEYRAIRTVANFFESMGVFVKNRIIDERLACDVWAGIVLRNWQALVPIITFVREDVGTPAVWENFEYLALLSDRYVRQNPQGGYPRGLPHMPEDRSFIEAVCRARRG